ncbi:MAG: hypothetical protein MZW92_35930 [Comamonadaceae bacterium]|nr:hypothetical protein [Comamonadaceae bacterium]
MFTLGAGHGTPAVARLGADLADLIENRIPDTVSARIEAGEGLQQRLDLQRQPYKVVLALREDFLADLESWSREIPSLLLQPPAPAADEQCAGLRRGVQDRRPHRRRHDRPRHRHLRRRRRARDGGARPGCAAASHAGGRCAGAGTRARYRACIAEPRLAGG